MTWAATDPDDRLGDFAPAHPAPLGGLPGLLHERGEIAFRRRLQHFENHDILVAEDDELCPGFEPETRPDLLGDDDLSLRGQRGGGCVAHACLVNLTRKISPSLARSKPRRHLAQLRQEAGLSQHAVADHVGIAQQTLAHYEVGRLRLPVALVPKLAQLFGVPTDVLLGVPGARPGKRGPTPKLQRRLERLARLPKAQQQLILDILKASCYRTDRTKPGQIAPAGLLSFISLP